MDNIKYFIEIAIIKTKRYDIQMHLSLYGFSIIALNKLNCGKIYSQSHIINIQKWKIFLRYDIEK